MRRVLLVVAEAYGSSGGIAQFNRNLIDSLAQRVDLEVKVLSLYGTTGAGEPSNIQWQAPAWAGKPGFSLSVLRSALSWQPDLVICGLIGMGSLSLLAVRLSRARLWSVVHGWEAWSKGPWFDNLGLEHSHMVTAVSSFTRDKLLAWSKLAPDSVHVLPNTVDLSRFRPGPRPAHLEERFGVSGSKVLLTVGRLEACDRYKGHDRILRLLPELQNTLGPVHYIIAGDGSDRPRLEALVKSLSITKSVTFTGRVPEHELQALYHLADLFVMPSTGEGFGIVFLEAMASGCPVLGGNRDGSVDALAHGDLGRLVDPENPTELLLALKEEIGKVRNRTQPIAGVERFALPAFRNRVHQLLDRVLSL